MVAQKETLRSLLLGLCDWQMKTWVRSSGGCQPHPKAVRAWETLKVRWVPLTTQDVEKSFRSQGAFDLNQLGKVLYLPPLEGLLPFVPALTMRCTLDKDCSDLELRVMLVSCEEDRCPHGLGYRMECGTEHHAFAHAQLVRGLQAGDDPKGNLIDSPVWLPTTQPSFPLPAPNSVTLLLAMLMSLYGLAYSQYVDPRIVIGIPNYMRTIMACMGVKTTS